MSQSSSQPDSLTDPVRQDPKPWDIVGGRRGIRLSTLSMMGWRALAGEIIVLLFTGLVLKLKLPVLPCALVVATGGLLNIGLVWVRDRDATDKVATVVLCLVNLQVTALLYFNGGVANPFAVVLIAPAVLAAATCKTNQALIVALTAYVAVLALTFWSWPLPWVAGETMSLPKLYIDGCGAALGIGIGFTAAYSWRASVESERMELALNVAHSALAREQRLSDLGALAAAAAHELGTPLATIQIVSKEIARGPHAMTPAQLREDAELLISQTERCREILRRLTGVPGTEDAMHARQGLLQFVNEVIEPHMAGPVRVEGVVSGPPGAQAPEIRRLPEITHALTTLVDNACDFAASEVLIRMRFDAAAITLEIRDDGPGFASEVLARLGQPYVTSRPQGQNSRNKHEGMGLGVFIARTLLERSGATIRFENAKRGGAVVAIRWPRSTIEAPPLHEFPQPGA